MVQPHQRIFYLQGLPLFMHVTIVYLSAGLTDDKNYIKFNFSFFSADGILIWCCCIHSKLVNILDYWKYITSHVSFAAA